MVGKDFRVSLSKNGLQCCTLELDGSCRLQRNWVDPERGACEVKKYYSLFAAHENPFHQR